MKSKSFRVWSLVAIAGLAVIALSLTRLSGSRDEPIPERVARLENEVSDLSSRVLALERQVAALRGSPERPGDDLPPGRAAWRSLRKGMSRDQVRGILGEPAAVDILSLFEIWRYGDEATVTFDESGSVLEWNGP